MRHDPPKGRIVYFSSLGVKPEYFTEFELQFTMHNKSAITNRGASVFAKHSLQTVVDGVKEHQSLPATFHQNFIENREPLR